jgi:hypothetical protein
MFVIASRKPISTSQKSENETERERYTLTEGSFKGKILFFLHENGPQEDSVVSDRFLGEIPPQTTYKLLDELYEGGLLTSHEVE